MIGQIKSELAKNLAKLTNRPDTEILGLLEVPKVYENGHLAYPVFALAKERRQPPPVVAAELAAQVQGQIPGLKDVKATGGFLNFTFSAEYLQQILMADLGSGLPLGHNLNLSGKNVLVDFSSPNIAKPMHIGHFRATIIGQSIYNLAQAQGANVTSINHIGDWGTQFGKLAWAYQKWGKDVDFTAAPIDSLVSLYVKFHEEAEKNPDLDKEAAALFLKLEQGDAELLKIWKFMVDASFVEYNRVYDLLNVKHDKVLGESFYNDKMDAVVSSLDQKGLLKESDGAQVVFFDDADKMTPCLIRKSDGASIYATRDLAAAIYRREVQKADQVLYVVGSPQALHFRQVFKVLEMMGYDWPKNYHHIGFGEYRFADGKMSSRKGKVILAVDLIEEAVEIIRKMISEKNPDLADKEKIARQVAAGAIIFNDLINDRVKNVEFDWARATNTEGDSGPYVQYMNVRCKSILRKYAKPVPKVSPRTWDTPEEVQLVFSMLQFGHVVDVSYRQFRPNILAQYLLELCRQFGSFYHKNRIIGEAADVESSRILLVSAASAILTEGLRLLNIPSPEAM